MTIVAKNSPSNLKSDVLPDDSDERTAENGLLSMRCNRSKKKLKIAQKQVKVQEN